MFSESIWDRKDDIILATCYLNYIAKYLTHCLKTQPKWALYTLSLLRTKPQWIELKDTFKEVIETFWTFALQCVVKGKSYMEDESLASNSTAMIFFQGQQGQCHTLISFQWLKSIALGAGKVAQWVRCLTCTWPTPVQFLVPHMVFQVLPIVIPENRTKRKSKEQPGMT